MLLVWQKSSRWKWDCIKDQVLSPFLFSMVMNRLTDEFGQESAWTVMFAMTLLSAVRAGIKWWKIKRGGGILWTEEKGRKKT